MEKPKSDAVREAVIDCVALALPLPDILRLVPGATTEDVDYVIRRYQNEIQMRRAEILSGSSMRTYSDAKSVLLKRLRMAEMLEARINACEELDHREFAAVVPKLIATWNALVESMGFADSKMNSEEATPLALTLVERVLSTSAKDPDAVMNTLLKLRQRIAAGENVDAEEVVAAVSSE